MLEVLNECECLEEAAGIMITLADITLFQEQAAHLKENIIPIHYTSSSDTASALSIFDPWKASKVDSPTNLSMVNKKSVHFWHTME